MNAVGGPVTWHVTGTSSSVRVESNSGTIPANHDEYLTAYTENCSGSGSVTFSTGATVGITWEC